MKLYVKLFVINAILMTLAQQSNLQTISQVTRKLSVMEEEQNKMEAFIQTIQTQLNSLTSQMVVQRPPLSCERREYPETCEDLLLAGIHYSGYHFVGKPEKLGLIYCNMNKVINQQQFQRQIILDFNKIITASTFSPVGQNTARINKNTRIPYQPTNTQYSTVPTKNPHTRRQNQGKLYDPNYAQRSPGNRAPSHSSTPSSTHTRQHKTIKTHDPRYPQTPVDTRSSKINPQPPSTHRKQDPLAPYNPRHQERQPSYGGSSLPSSYNNETISKPYNRQNASILIDNTRQPRKKSEHNKQYRPSRTYTGLSHAHRQTTTQRPHPGSSHSQPDNHHSQPKNHYHQPDNSQSQPGNRYSGSDSGQSHSDNSHSQSNNPYSPSGVIQPRYNDRHSQPDNLHSRLDDTRSQIETSTPSTYHTQEVFRRLNEIERKADKAQRTADNVKFTLENLSVQGNTFQIAKQPVVFSAYRTKPKYDSNSYIQFNNVVINTGGGYDPYSSLFVAPQQGVYMFSFTLRNTKPGLTVVHLLKNENEPIGVATATKSESDKSDQTFSLTVITKLRKNDSVGLFLEKGGIFNYQDNYENIFIGMLL